MGRNLKSGDTVEAILRIRKTTVLDFGEYTCQAENEIGADVASIVLERGSGGVDVVAYLPYIGSAAVGVILVLIIIALVYFCRRSKQSNQATTLAYPDEIIALNTGDKPIIRHGAEIYSNKKINNLEAGVVGIGGGNAYALLNSDHHQRPSPQSTMLRPLSNVPDNYTAFYGNARLNSRLPGDEDRISSRSSSHSTLPPESYSRPPPNSTGFTGAGDPRRSNSPYNSDAVDYSTSSTMSSIVSRGSKPSR